MGIRFKCHHCEADLNIKEELASKRGICPSCKRKFRIPQTSCDYSLPLDETKGGSKERPTPAAIVARNKAPIKQSIRELRNNHPSKTEAKSPKKPTKSELKQPSPRNPTIAPLPVTVDLTPPKPVEPLDEIESQYFVRPPSGGEYGPASKSTIEEWISQRRVTPDSLVCKLGSSEWLKAKDVFVLKFLFP